AGEALVARVAVRRARPALTGLERAQVLVGALGEEQRLAVLEVGAQLLLEGQDRRVALARVAGHGLRAQLRQALRDVGAVARWRTPRRRQQDLDQRAALMWRCAGEHLVQGRAEQVDVGPGANVLAAA